MTPAAPDRCSPWLWWIQLPVMYWSKMRLRHWNRHSDSLAIVHFLPQQCVAPHIVKQTLTKAVARPWTEVNKRTLICAIPPSPSVWRLTVCEHNNILSGQTRKILNPFTRGDLTTSCSLLWQVNESKAWSSAEASSGPVSLNLGGTRPPLTRTISPLPKRLRSVTVVWRKQGPATLYALTWPANPPRLNKLNLHLWDGANQRAKTDLCK